MVRSQIPFSFELVETNREIERLILQDIVRTLNIGIPKLMPAIDRKIRNATVHFLKNTTTYNSLVNGDLAAHFGIPARGREGIISAITEAVATRMEIEFIPITLQGLNLAHGIRFRVLLRDLSEVLNLGEAKVLTEKGQTLEWLRWLLTLGDTIIISEYEIQLASGKGRSGGGIMIADDAGSWRVPPEYAGTQGNNWLTRALVDNRQAYFDLVEYIIKQELQRL